VSRAFRPSLTLFLRRRKICLVERRRNAIERVKRPHAFRPLRRQPIRALEPLVDLGRLGLYRYDAGDVLTRSFTPPRSSPPSIAPRPRVAARSPMSGPERPRRPARPATRWLVDDALAAIVGGNNAPLIGERAQRAGASRWKVALSAPGSPTAYRHPGKRGFQTCPGKPPRWKRDADLLAWLDSLGGRTYERDSAQKGGNRRTCQLMSRPPLVPAVRRRSRSSCA
jgi:hypothetical protein